MRHEGGAVQLGLEEHHEYKVLLQKWSRVCSALPGCWSQVATEEDT